MVEKTAQAHLPTKHGLFTMHVYRCSNGIEHIALVKGVIRNPMLTRVHSSCVTGDIFSSLKCDCGEQLEKSMEIIERNGSGIILYLNQEGRGIGLTNKIKAYALQEKGYDTVEANTLLGLPVDARNYAVAADILKDLGVDEIELLTNNPEKEHQLLQHDIQVVKQVPLEIKPNAVNKEYLSVKKKKMSHRLSYV